MTDRDKAFEQWWNLAIFNGVLPELRKGVAREAYFAAWGDGSQFGLRAEIERLSHIIVNLEKQQRERLQVIRDRDAEIERLRALKR